MLVLERVRSSTRLTMTAQAVLGPIWPFFMGLPGSAPGTTTEYSGTSPIKISPVSRSTILVEAPRNTPIDSTAPLRTITPSATSERAPMKQSSSMMTGSACRGSTHTPTATHAAGGAAQRRRGAREGGSVLRGGGGGGGGAAGC